MKFNLLSGILLILLLITSAYAFIQKTDADAARTMAEQNEEVAIRSEEAALRQEKIAVTLKAYAEVISRRISRIPESRLNFMDILI
jgi:uncharacterized protein YxeA